MAGPWVASSSAVACSGAIGAPVASHHEKRDARNSFKKNEVLRSPIERKSFTVFGSPRFGRWESQSS